MNVMKMLPQVGAVLSTLDHPTEDQKEAFMYHLQCLMAILGACVSARYTHNIPDLYHSVYLKYVGEKIVSDTEIYLFRVSPLGYVDTKEMTAIITALKEEVRLTTVNALGDPKRFSDWHTVA